jgi:hypothetical protein
MNEQIRELAEQAGLGKERWNTTEQFNSFLAKFAELIVKECSAFVYNYPEKYLTRNQAREISMSMEEHFGIE